MNIRRATKTRIPLFVSESCFVALILFQKDLTILTVYKFRIGNLFWLIWVWSFGQPRKHINGSLNKSTQICSPEAQMIRLKLSYFRFCGQSRLGTDHHLMIHLFTCFVWLWYSKESSPTPNFKSVNTISTLLLQSPIFTSTERHREYNCLYQFDLCRTRHIAVPEYLFQDFCACLIMC